MGYEQSERMAERISGKRARILAAARAIVAEEGWIGATVSNVAARAGVATGTVYRHWPSKADLCVEVVASVSANEVRVLDKIATSAETPRTKLRSAVSVFLRRALRGRRLAYALIAEPCDPEVEGVRLEYRAEVARCIARILEEGVEAGEFEVSDCTVSATCLVGAFMEALVGPLLPLGRRGKDEDGLLVDKVTEICMRASLRPLHRDDRSTNDVREQR